VVFGVGVSAATEAFTAQIFRVDQLALEANTVEGGEDLERDFNVDEEVRGVEELIEHRRKAVKSLEEQQGD